MLKNKYNYEIESYEEIFYLHPEKEKWKKITKLFRMNSKYEIINVYYFNSDYYISTHGRLMIEGKIKNTKYQSNGYLCNQLIDVNGNYIRFKRHQIVQQTFNKESYEEKYTIDHIERLKKYDNSIFNLRWANKQTQVYNRENKKYKYKKVKCDNDGKIFDSCQKAEVYYNLTPNTVSRVARGERKSIHKLYFSYI